MYSVQYIQQHMFSLCILYSIFSRHMISLCILKKYIQQKHDFTMYSTQYIQQSHVFTMYSTKYIQQIHIFTMYSAIHYLVTVYSSQMFVHYYITAFFLTGYTQVISTYLLKVGIYLKVIQPYPLIYCDPIVKYVSETLPLPLSLSLSLSLSLTLNLTKDKMFVPEVHHVTDYLSIYQVKLVITDGTPGVVIKHFYTTLKWGQSSCQAHWYHFCKHKSNLDLPICLVKHTYI